MSNGIPSYATACSNSSQYASACSCMGVTARTITLNATATTVTITISTTQTSTVSSASPISSCTANTQTDPNNCGSCGNVCSTGVCNNGICSSAQCPSNQTCDAGFHSCSTGDCFCFSDHTGAGFCGQDALCSGITSCANDDDCAGGSICAMNTCCPAPSAEQPGVCLVGECGNPATKLARMASAVRRSPLGVNTAGRRGYQR
ncbi:hypothetical protein M430DRAFT_49369 [Amorphotheca resinae ATCC 22711]|uniref:Uncharacterized protein n=1 Tax=Amorphotheca resinae ATCC 22711 TaxID=857342 RepID=A0A2T3B649_AMORE|nr:hypothetical protein M430DRAFT_49369 [Amorphotheca resinae ATCC 22711]PSS22218.1 hypothetical protein M430DRAFT_49369 [Amorphotheca resinae ATCC 22711]